MTRAAAKRSALAWLRYGRETWDRDTQSYISVYSTSNNLRIVPSPRLILTGTFTHDFKVAERVFTPDIDLLCTER